MMPLASFLTRIENRLFRKFRLESAPILLHWRRIYILPTWYGVTFAFTLLLLFVASINYTLSLGYLLTFFLTAISIAAMLHTCLNLRGLTIRWQTPHAVFANTDAIFPFIVESLNGKRPSIHIVSKDGYSQTIDSVQQSVKAQILIPATKRGILHPGKIIVETRYPLGLFRAWARLLPNIQCIVYPAPSIETVPLPVPAGNIGIGFAHSPGDDELQSLRAYQLGDSPRRIAWYAFAKERGLLTKQFAAEGGKEIWIDLETAPGVHLEAKLSQLTRWILDAEEAGIPYGMRIPGSEWMPNLGEAHLRCCLETLALYGIEKNT